MLNQILSLPANAPELLLRRDAYRPEERTLLVRDVLAMANQAAPPARYIVFGAAAHSGRTRLTGLDENSLRTLHGMTRDLVERIEPELLMNVVVAEQGGKRALLIELNDCFDPPYVTRLQLAESLRTGACWVREGDTVRPARRPDLEKIYARREATGGGRIELGLGDDAGRQVMHVVIPDTSEPPSERARQKLKLAMESRQTLQQMLGSEDSGLARLAHTRIFGADVPFVSRGMDTLIEGYKRIAGEYVDADNYYRYEEKALKMNFTLRVGDAARLEAAAIDLSLPRVAAFDVADRIYADPSSPTGDTEHMLLGYPAVKCTDGAALVHCELGDLPGGAKRTLLETSLRLMVGPEMQGRKVAIRYQITANNLPRPLNGRLKIVFSLAQPAGGSRR